MFDPNNLPPNVVRAMKLMHTAAGLGVDPVAILTLTVIRGIVTDDEAEQIIDLVAERIKLIDEIEALEAAADGAAVKDMLDGAEAYLREQAQ
jgi:hypothetical protein